jgi:hypothetical protein
VLRQLSYERADRNSPQLKVKKRHKKAQDPNPIYTLHNIEFVSGSAAAVLASLEDHEVVWLYPSDSKRMSKALKDDEERNANGHPIPEPELGADERGTVRRLFAKLFSVEMCAITDEDLAKLHEKLQSPAKTREEALSKLPAWLHDLPQYFNPNLKDKPLLPLRLGRDHPIDLIPGSVQPAARMYGLNQDEGYAVLAYVQDSRSRGKIRESKSEFASLVLVVKKPGDGLRVCVDYRMLNAVTRKNRNAPPMIQETLARLSNVGYYSQPSTRSVCRKEMSTRLRSSPGTACLSTLLCRLASAMRLGRSRLISTKCGGSAWMSSALPI